MGDRDDKLNWKEIKEILTDWRLYIHYLTYTTVSPLIASLSLFSPVIVAGMGYENLDAQLFTVPLYTVAYILTHIFAWLSDKYRNCGLITCGSFTIAGITFLVQGTLSLFSISRTPFLPLPPSTQTPSLTHWLPLSRPPHRLLLTPLRNACLRNDRCLRWDPSSERIGG